MKKKIAVLAFVAASLGATATSWAFQSTQIATVTAGTFIGGQKVARFTLAIKDTSDPFGTTRSSVTWSNVVAGGGWKIADQLIVLNSTVTDNNGGVQIYTDNTAADAVPKFVDPTPGNATNPDSAAAGLLKGNAAGNTSEILPMAWSIKSTVRTVESGTAVTGIGAADPNTGPTTATRDSRFQWLFVTDKSNSSGIDFNQDGDITDPTDSSPFVNGNMFISMVRAAGLHFGQGPGDIEGRLDGLDAYVYLEANFASAAAQQAYQTSTLRIEAFIE